MNLNTHGLLFVVFVMGAVSTLIAERLLLYSPEDIREVQIEVETTPTEEIATKPSWQFPVTSSDDNLDRSSSGAVTAVDSNQPPRATSASECVPASQQEKSVQQDYNQAEGGELDPALQEERYAFDVASQEREHHHILQEAILTMEEETNLYEPPPDDYEMSAEEQDALENDSMKHPMSSADTAEEEQFLQQALENESRINALYEDQDISGIVEREE